MFGEDRYGEMRRLHKNSRDWRKKRTSGTYLTIHIQSPRSEMRNQLTYMKVASSKSQSAE